MIIRILIIQSFLVLFFSCKENKSSKAKQSDTIKDSIDPKIESSSAVSDNHVQDTITLGQFTSITSKSTIEILSLNKFVDTAYQYYERRKVGCTNWNLDNESIKKILKLSEPISSHDQHYLYDVFPCNFQGEAIINNQRATFEVNAGAFTTVIFKDSIIVLGYKKSDFKKFFLLGPGI